jgi:3-hydroxyacyl-[acyl-carrier-protein] dehydratase
MREVLKNEKRLEKLLRITKIAAIMRFILIDKVVSLELGREIKAVKSVSLAEEYLADHFPAFPVLPGVLLLEGLIESASWLVRETENFAHSMILLEQARNVKYKSFLAPGAQIEYTVQAKTIEENVSSFLGFGLLGDERIVEAKFGLRHFNLADEDSAMVATDARIIEALKKRWKLLRN